MKRYIEIAVDVILAFAAYYWLGWIGFALWALFVMSWLMLQAIDNQHLTMKLLSQMLLRLPDRCAFCHREIVDEGGVFDEEGIYHEKCSDALFSLEEHRRIAGVPYREAIQVAKPRTQKNAADAP